MSQSGTLPTPSTEWWDGSASAGPGYQVRLLRFLVRSEVEPPGYHQDGLKRKTKAVRDDYPSSGQTFHCVSISIYLRGFQNAGLLISGFFYHLFKSYQTSNCNIQQVSLYFYIKNKTSSLNFWKHHRFYKETLALYLPIVTNIKGSSWLISY